ncbi:hypothetical protein Poli38472_010088 [Pythium oligandrum]|uniref:Peroxin/Ferlin domain-containing protein n=1 Tax=Pythium oligandrum TaxID=41045 RepID=A0A8K1FF15_PYTOL|nr:hypothetical protein Poli38472_010088 [Pythium oligandrum]|eukprot:TMW58529.1 hypothetical protein Poli38472_010088 [Pythium oligandrum]
MEAKRSVASLVLQAAQENESHVSQFEGEHVPSGKGYHARLTAFFWAHDPRRVDKVNEILERQKGREEEYIQRVHMEYGVRDFGGEVAVDDIYEHERYSYLSFSWGSSFPGHLLPTDRRRWSGLHGSPSSQTRAKVEPQLPVNWQWTSEWEVDKATSNCDAEGWIYAFDFTTLNFMVKRDGGRKEPKSTDYVRRRRWIRRRERIPTALPTPVPSPVREESVKSTMESSGEDNNDEDGDRFDSKDGLFIPDTLDVDDDEGEDPGDDDDEQGEDEEPAALRDFIFASRVEAPRPATPGSPATQSPAAHTEPEPVTLKHYSLSMDKAAVDAAWKKAVKNLEAVYTQAKRHQALKKKRWKVKKEKIRQQMNLLEKTIAAMQSFAHEDELQRRHSSSVLLSSPHSRSKSKSKRVPMPTTPTASMSPEGRSRVSDNDTGGINLARKLHCAQSKLDALRRLFWHPREKDYTLRFSIDGIFYGLRDFLVESFKSSYSIHLSHQSNGAQGITPTCKIVLKGHTVCCGKHVKVVGEKGTIVPKSIWSSMYLDTDFDASIHMIYVEDVEDERNPWLEGKPMGRWEFLFSPESTRVELFNFNRRTRGGVDLPEPVVRKLMSDVLSSLLRDIALLYFPQELAMAFEAPPGKLDWEGVIDIAGPPVDNVMEREMEMMSTAPPPERSVESSGTEASPKSGTPTATAAVTAPFVAVAAVATATVNLLVGSDTERWMREIAELLELRPAQLNLLIALRQCGLYPAPYTFRSVTSLCEYYNAFFIQEREDGGSRDEELRTAWQQLLELLYIRKMKAATAPPDEEYPMFELFDMDKLFTRVAQLTRKPVAVKLTVSRFHCTVDATNVVEAMAQLYERLVLGIDFSKPRVGPSRLIYGFRFGRKPKVATTAAMAAHSQTTQLLDPATHLQMDTDFRSRLKAFSKLCRTLKSVIELIKQNLETVSLEVAGTVRGTGSDCEVRGSFRDLEFSGPANLSLHVPALFLGKYRIETIPLGDDRIGLQIDVLVPTGKKMRTKQVADDVLVRLLVSDFTMDVLLDVDALIARHHHRSITAATETTAPWSPSASFAQQIETQKTKQKHSALSIAVNSTTGITSHLDDTERVIRIPSPTARPGEPYGKLRVATSEFTKLQVRAKSGTLSLQMMLVLRLLIDTVRPFVQASFPEHQVLFERIYGCLLRWISSKAMQMDFDMLFKGFIHDTDKLFFTVCGSPAHPMPMVYHDELNLLDVILQADDLVNIWIDDRYPPYSNPLYF